MTNNTKEHWEQVYQTRGPEQLSWTQEIPRTSLDFIHSFELSKTAKIIDIGGGDSKLVDYLLDEGFENITVLDISRRAIDKAKSRLGPRTAKVRWVVCDITEFETQESFDVWHDRATFHFLTAREQVAKYVDLVTRVVRGYLVVGTFSTSGPKKCSGLDVIQYNEQTLAAEFEKGFDKLSCITEDHTTPFHTNQNFLFCSFKRRLN